MSQDGFEAGHACGVSDPCLAWDAVPITVIGAFAVQMHFIG